MKQLAKSWLFWTFIAVLGLIAAIILTLKMINFNAYKPQIEKVFLANTGLSLDIQGNIHWGAPWRFEIEIDNIVIKDPRMPKSTPPLATVAELDVVFKLKSILHQNFIPHEVRVAGATLAIAPEQHWDFMPTMQGQGTSSAGSSTPLFGDFGRFAVIVENSNIIFDAGTKSEQTLGLNQSVFTLNLLERKMKLTGIASYTGQPFDVVAQLNYADSNFNPPYDIKINLITENNALSFTGTMGRYDKTEQGYVQAEGNDLAKLLRIFGLNYSTMGSYKFESQAQLSQHGIALDAIAGTLFNGTMTGNLGIDWSHPDNVHYAFDVMGHNLDAGRLLKSLGLSDQMTGGHLSVHYQMQTAGDSGNAFLAHQTGTLFLGIVQGRYKSRGLAVYTQRLFHLLSSGASNDTTELNCVLLQVKCQNGNCDTQALAIDTPGADVVGQGALNFNNNTIDLLLIPTSKNVNLNPLALPMSVKGNLQNPTVLPAGGQLTVDVTNTLLNIVTGRAFTQLTAGHSSSEAQNLGACVNTLQNYQQKQNQSVTHKVGQEIKHTTDRFVSKLENL